MFAPYKLRELELVNRVVVSPMAMCSARAGTPTDFHLVHLGTRAQGGAGLLYTDMTSVSSEGRITQCCGGMSYAEHVVAWRALVALFRSSSQANICPQPGPPRPQG